MSNEGHFEAYTNTIAYVTLPQDRAIADQITIAVRETISGSQVHWAGSLAKHTAITGSDLDFWVDSPSQWTLNLRRDLAERLTKKGHQVKIFSHVVRILQTPKCDISFKQATFGARLPPDDTDFYNRPQRQQAARAFKLWNRSAPLPRIPGWVVEALVISLDQGKEKPTGFALFLHILNWLVQKSSPGALESILRPKAKPAWRPEWSTQLPGQLQALQNSARSLLRRDFNARPFTSRDDAALWLRGG